MKTYYSILAFLFLSFIGFGQDTRKLLVTYRTGSPSSKVKAASDLAAIYISENKDSLATLGEDLFYYGIDEHYFPAIETGKLILSEYYVEIGKTADGILTAKALLANMEERGDDEQLSIACKIISQGYRLEKDASSAMYWAEKSIKHSTKCSDPEVQTYGMISLAEAYILKNQKSKGIKEYQNYLAKAKPLGLKRGMSAAYARLGDIYRLAGDLKQAEKFFKESYSLAKELGLTTSLGHAINNLAIIYFEKGDTVKAREYFEIGLEKRLKAKDQRAIADSYYNIGDYQFYIGKTALAETWYKRSLEYARSNNLRNEQKDALFVLANLYKNTNDFKQANHYLERYIDLQDETIAQNLKDDEEIKNKQLEFMRLEIEAESEGLMSDDGFWKQISVEWIVIVVLATLSVFLALRLRKQK